MLNAMFQALLRGVRRSRRAACFAQKSVQPVRFAPSLQALEGREMPAVFALFNPAAGGNLTVFGDAQDNAITVSRDAAGSILVNGGAVAVQGGTPTVANTALDQRLRAGRQRHDHPRRGQRHPAEGEPLRRRRQRRAHRRLRGRPSVRPGGQRHSAGQGRQRPAVRRRRQRRPDRRQGRRPGLRRRRATTA